MDAGGHWWGWLIGIGVLALIIVLVVWADEFRRRREAWRA